MDTLSPLLRKVLAGVCPQEAVETAVDWVRSGGEGQPALPFGDRVFQYKTIPVPGSEEPDFELEVALLRGRALWILRITSEGTTSILVPFRVIDRVRTVAKPEKTTVEIYHGECITWLEQAPDALYEGDLLSFATSLQHTVARPA